MSYWIRRLGRELDQLSPLFELAVEGVEFRVIEAAKGGCVTATVRDSGGTGVVVSVPFEDFAGVSIEGAACFMLGMAVGTIRQRAGGVRATGSACQE